MWVPQRRCGQKEDAPEALELASLHKVVEIEGSVATHVRHANASRRSW